MVDEDEAPPVDDRGIFFGCTLELDDCCDAFGCDPSVGADVLWALGPVDVSSFTHEGSSLFQKSTSSGLRPSLKFRGMSQLSKLCMPAGCSSLGLGQSRW